MGIAFDTPELLLRRDDAVDWSHRRIMVGLFQRLTFLDTLRMVPLRFSMAFVVARDRRSNSGRATLQDRECFFHPFD